MSSEIRDVNLWESGETKIQWVKANMPLLRGIEEEFAAEKPFAGIKVALSVHLEAKTAYLCRVLAAGGADGSVGGLLQESDYGVGLRNVKRTVEKYGGTMRAEQEQGKFCLRMMLCLEPSAKGASLPDKEK